MISGQDAAACGGCSMGADGAPSSLTRRAGKIIARGIAAGGPSCEIGGRRRFHCQRRMRSRSVPDEMPCSAQISPIGWSVCS
jgi:hypothetical protein